MFEIVKTNVFTKPVFDAKPPGIDLMMTLAHSFVCTCLGCGSGVQALQAVSSMHCPWVGQAYTPQWPRTSARNMTSVGKEALRPRRDEHLITQGPELRFKVLCKQAVRWHRSS